MKRVISLLIIIVICLISLAYFSKPQEKEEVITNNDESLLISLEDAVDVHPKTHLSFDLLDESFDIYTPSRIGYRYGPSILENEDGSYDIWCSSPGNNSSNWDYIRYVHMDSEYNLNEEKIVLKPTSKSFDTYSTCDPGVIYFNGYYYLAYTSTASSNQYNNSIFVARSTSPDGPYEKWNGTSWGGNPYPVLFFDAQDDNWGYGEPSFVIKKDRLYMYYSSRTSNENCTNLATFSMTDDWPSTITYEGTVIQHGDGEDSYDIAYIEDLDKFVGFSVNSRMNEDSGIILYESDDGRNFTYSDTISKNIKSYAHNLGISKDSNGHIQSTDTILLGYAYSPDESNKWGKWSLLLQPIQLKQIEE